MMKPITTLTTAVMLFVLLGNTPGFGQSTPYFQGKTILLVQGREPGGTGALRVQAAIPFLKKYLPGEPIIVTQFMPGGGGRKASNYIARNAKPDGLTLGTSVRAWSPTPCSVPPASSTISTN